MSESLLRRISLAVEGLLAVLYRNRVAVWRTVYCGLAGYLFVSATISRFGVPLDPLADPDVAAYLSPALSKLNGSLFTHVNGVNFLYPGAMFLILGAVRDFRAIAIVQHLLGLIAGGLFLLAWNRLYDLCPTPRIGRAGHQAIGLFGAAIFLLSNQPAFLELKIRSDAVCPFFQLLTLWLTLEFFHSRFVLREGRRAVLYGCAAVASAWLLASLKPSFLLFALLTIAIVGWLALGLPGPRLKLAFGVTVTAIILAISLPEQFLRRSDPASRRYLTETLFAVHAKLIRVQIEKDLRSGESGDYSAAWLREANQELREALAEKHPLSFPSLGFQPDYMMAGPDGLFWRWTRELGGEKAFLKFLRYYYWRALLHRPFAFTSKVALQMSTFYWRPCPAFSIHRNLPLAPKYYLESRAALERASMQNVRAQEFGRAYLSRTDSLLTTIVKLREGPAIQSSNVLLAQSYRFVVLPGGIIALWLLIRRRRSQSNTCAPLLTVFLCLPNLANTFGISFLHTMDVARYSQVQFGAALLAELWILRWLLAWCLPGMDRFTSWMRTRSVRALS